MTKFKNLLLTPDHTFSSNMQNIRGRVGSLHKSEIRNNIMVNIGGDAVMLYGVFANCLLPIANFSLKGFCLERRNLESKH
jgi:hypothetical protein